MANSPLKGVFSNDDILRLVKIATGSLPAASSDNKGALAYDSTTDSVKFSNGTSWTTTGGGVGGSGTTNQLAYWSSSSAIAGDSGLTYDAANDRLTAAGGFVGNGPTSFGGRVFNTASASNTIPSDKQVVRLNSSIGDITFIGTPVIDDGLFEGQRLITIVDAASTGNFTFAAGTGRKIQPITASVILHHGGGAAQEAVEWVWTDGYWKQVAAPAQAGASGSEWAAAVANTGINATVTATSFTPTTGTDSDAVIAPLGAGSLLAQIPDGTTTGGDKRGGGATDFQRYRSGSAQVASGLYSFIGAGQNNTAAGSYDIVVGGDTNYTATGVGAANHNVVVGGYFNGIVTSGGGGYNFIGGGSFNAINSATQSCAIVGGDSNFIGSGAQAWCFIGSGYQNTVSPATTGYGSILNGNNNSVTAVYGTVLGGAWGSDRGIKGRTVISQSDDLSAGPLGYFQTAIQVTKAVTTDNTATPLTTDGLALDGVNANVIATVGTAYKVRAEVIAVDNTSGDMKAWTLECLAGNTAAGTGIIGTPPAAVVVGNSGVAWTATLTWDGTTKSIYVEVVGDAAHSVSWTCTMLTTEVGYTPPGP